MLCTLRKVLPPLENPSTHPCIGLTVGLGKDGLEEGRKEKTRNCVVLECERLQGLEQVLLQDLDVWKLDAQR